MDALDDPAALGFDPHWSIAPDIAEILLAQVKRAAPLTVVELGSGWSTVLLAAALSEIDGAQLVSVDEDAGWLAHTQHVLAEQGLDRVCRLVHAPVRESRFTALVVEWYDVTLPLTGRPIDLLFVDGPSNPPASGGRRRYPALPVLGHFLAADAVVIVDDANRDGEREMVQRWLTQRGWEVEWLATQRGCAILRRSPISPPISAAIPPAPTAR